MIIIVIINTCKSQVHASEMLQTPRGGKSHPMVDKENHTKSVLRPKDVHVLCEPEEESLLKEEFSKTIIKFCIIIIEIISLLTESSSAFLESSGREKLLDHQPASTKTEIERLSATENTELEDQWRDTEIELTYVRGEIEKELGKFHMSVLYTVTLFVLHILLSVAEYPIHSY